MSDKNVAMLQELVQIARDSKSFYDSAAPVVNNAKIKEVFERMSNAKSQLIQALSPHIMARGETPELGGTMAGSLRQTYADLLAMLSRKDSVIYTEQLEETEDRLIKHFNEALQESDSMELQSVLKAQLPKVQACHDEMKRLKDSLTT